MSDFGNEPRVGGAAYTKMLDKRGRLVIPLEMRTAMGMPKGGRLDWRVENGEIILRRVREGRSDA